MSGLQKIANPPANNQSNLDPIFSKGRRLARLWIVLGKPMRPSVKLSDLGQMPATAFDASRVGPAYVTPRGGFQGREKPFYSSGEYNAPLFSAGPLAPAHSHCCSREASSSSMLFEQSQCSRRDTSTRSRIATSESCLALSSASASRSKSLILLLSKASSWRRMRKLFKS